MVALTAPRNTREMDRIGNFNPPVAAAVVIHAGALVVRNAAGFAAPGSTALGLVAIGRAEESVTGGVAAGDLRIEVKPGTFPWANSAAADLLTIADIGDDCFIVDDQTVAKTSAAGTRSIAGKVVDVDAAGVWVATGILRP